MDRNGARNDLTRLLGDALPRLVDMARWLTSHNLGGGDEYATLDDLFAVFHVLATTVFDFLSRPSKD